MSIAVRLLPAALLLWPGPARAQVSIPLKIAGNQATGTVQLPGGLGAELTLSFEGVVGLNPSALQVSARVVNPLDPGLLLRLPVGGQVSVPVGFPVLLRIEPSPTSALSFSGPYALSLYTHNLNLPSDLSLVVYSGPTGGPLADITSFVAMGSYRGGGSGGAFSEFIVVADIRPIDTIIVQKFDVLDNTVAGNAESVPPAIVTKLQNRLGQARSLYASGVTTAAIAEVTAFADYVKAHSGSSIPDVWRAHDDKVNVAGLLRSQAATLRFSLNVKASRSP